ncbi:MAG: molybdopterin synthase catalytic subunit MoaE [Thauera sp.]|jgi:molybdopterin synthase catalytic subunit
MQASTEVSVQEADFDLGAELAQLSAGRADVGGIASFVGLVRDVNDGSGVHAMTLEHYPGMTERSLAEIVEQAKSRWALLGVRVIHRIGRLMPSERIVFVGVASRHRGDAFAACEFIMDYLKTQAPFWKREETPEGARWVDARETDDSAAARWERPAEQGADGTWDEVEQRR